MVLQCCCWIDVEDEKLKEWVCSVVEMDKSGECVDTDIMCMCVLFMQLRCPFVSGHTPVLCEQCHGEQKQPGRSVGAVLSARVSGALMSSS